MLFFSLKTYALRRKFAKKFVLPPYDLSNASVRAKLFTPPPTPPQKKKSDSKQLLSMKTQS